MFLAEAGSLLDLDDLALDLVSGESRMAGYPMKMKCRGRFA